MASHPDVDIVVVATAGKAGLLPTLAAARAGKAIALANKEVLVMAGHLVVAEARLHQADLRPVDSEHSAIWQCLWGEDRKNIARIILTGSGGAFRDKPLDELERVTPEQALRHPTWQMGHKITVDSATLLNKGLEAIEAHWLFGVPFDKIEVVLHRESIIHSLVEFCDGSIKAQLGMPDMRLPIQCALTYPQRLPTSRPKRLDLGRLGSLAFCQPDLRRFPCLSLALEAGRSGGVFPTVMAGADEVAVDHFLAGHITFLDIAKVIEATLSAQPAISDPGLEEVLAADTWARQWAEDWLRAKA
jgi:1-deoxy-D-xylulose-5-phosphate reductoisomerase